MSMRAIAPVLKLNGALRPIREAAILRFQHHYRVAALALS
jgi:hypothetical protein